MPYTPKRETIEIVLIIVGLLIVIPIVLLPFPKQGDVIRYDCSIAEISPDFPIEVKEQCRKLRADNILQKPK
jgi:hypothetical protein